jgi:hypothetical protein
LDIVLKEAINWLREHFTDQAKVVPVVIEGISPSKRKKLVWHPEKKDLIELERERPDNAHKLRSIEAVIQYVLKHPAKTNVWVGPDKITVECVENNPKDFAFHPFVFNPLFKVLQELNNRPSLPQAQGIKLLRQQLSPFDPGAKALTVARNLKIATVEDYESEQSNITARLGKSVMASASGATDLPEYLNVTTQVYLKGGATGYPIRVWMSVDLASKGNLLFEPDKAQLEEAMLLERTEIVGILTDALKGTDVAIYEGEYCVS